jgi:hypothetical protein
VPDEHKTILQKWETPQNICEQICSAGSGLAEMNTTLWLPQNYRQLLENNHFDNAVFASGSHSQGGPMFDALGSLDKTNKAIGNQHFREAAAALRSLVKSLPWPWMRESYSFRKRIIVGNHWGTPISEFWRKRKTLRKHQLWALGNKG